MPKVYVCLRALGCALLLAIAGVAGAAQDLAEAKAWVEQYAKYFKYESKFSAEDKARLAELRVKVHSPATSLEDRQAALTDFAKLLFRAAGTTPPPPEQALVNFGKTNGAALHRLVTDPNSKPVTGATPLGQLGRVEKHGRGPVTLILLADIRTDGSMYQSFIERNSDRYTMYAVTLPGYGGTPAPPRPDTLDLSGTPWLNGVKKGVLELMAKNNLSKPVIVGSSGSAYLAAQLVLEQPEKFRAAVLVDGAVYMPFRSLANPDFPATLAERADVLTKQPGAIGMIGEFLPVMLPSREAAEARIKALPPVQLGQFFGSLHDLERARAMAIGAAVNSDPRAARYNTELFSLDLLPAFKDLNVPVLAIPAIHDDNSPGQGGPGLGQWNELKLKYPAIPLTVAPFQSTRAYVTEDAPKEFDAALEAFLAGKPVEGKKAARELAARPSPRAAVMQAVGASEVSITYGSPQINKRTVWGQLVPYNRVWRAGANEATMIRFGGDVLIEGQKLPAGRYTLFMIPAENEWTVIFNKVTEQWGHFSYNPEFDVLKVKVKPGTAEHQEYLNYSFEVLSQTSANVVLRWEKAKVAFKVELEPAKGAASGN
ncbi:MAG TPA: alpha/beta fold hydrolase [Blastocatellia bacterium]|nr:alpha/beta fold hydrolase [Blastocatellia bacterium]HMV85997.1 alpha/beta fold hydrolase [Blastocatellia bacterium]HMX26322.1 alpha/beta fold hydrolase [Blastocatellia bacterium]HNG34171.1 alpha/beta fold hydrolase [Blastocatellia bacterium]